MATPFIEADDLRTQMLIRERENMAEKVHRVTMALDAAQAREVEMSHRIRLLESQLRVALKERDDVVTQMTEHQNHVSELEMTTIVLKSERENAYTLNQVLHSHLSEKGRTLDSLEKELATVKERLMASEQSNWEIQAMADEIARINALLMHNVQSYEVMVKSLAQAHQDEIKSYVSQIQTQHTSIFVKTKECDHLQTLLKLSEAIDSADTAKELEMSAYLARYHMESSRVIVNDLEQAVHTIMAAGEEEKVKPVVEALRTALECYVQYQMESERYDDEAMRIFHNVKKGKEGDDDSSTTSEESVVQEETSGPPTSSSSESSSDESSESGTDSDGSSVISETYV
eukprot:PhF_6_TR1245/c0_g1_i1/m.2352